MTRNLEPSAGGHHALSVGWAVSAVAHTAVVVAVLTGLPAREIIEAPEAFRWDVQLVASSPHSDSGPSAASLSSQQTGVTTPAEMQARVEQTGIATRVRQRMDTRPRRETRVPNPPTSTPDRMEQKEGGRRHDEEWIDDMEGVEHSTPIEGEKVPPEVVLPKDPLTGRNPSQASSTEPAVTSVTREERVVETRASSIMDGDTASPLAAQPTARQEEARTSPDSGLVAPPTNEPETSTSFVGSEQRGAQSPGSAPSVGHADSAGPESPHAPVANAGASPASPAPGEATRRDYGWLAHTIRARIEEVKRYSAEARVNEWEGRVVISASILPDGRIIEVRVLESSGNQRLDEDAKTMVGHASPLALSQPIELAKVTVKVPIIFGLRR